MITEGASASGVATLSGDRVLDVYYPEPRIGVWGEAGTQRTGQAAYDDARGVTVPAETSNHFVSGPAARCTNCASVVVSTVCAPESAR